jgi:NADH dehydrogenase (ubiquinone) Fe-S protein 2
LVVSYKFITLVLYTKNVGKILLLLIFKKSFKQVQSFGLNFGPQHPAAHRVLRLILKLQGEQIINADPHIRLLHRRTEKLVEFKTFSQALPYFDRLDYVSIIAQEHCYSIAVEELIQLSIPIRVKFIRVIFLEITRILNHLIAVTAHAIDVGALTPFLWAFEEREKLMEFYERVSGARIHAAFIRPRRVAFELPFSILADIYTFIYQFTSRLDEIEELLTNNRIWKQRLVNIRTVSVQNALDWRFSRVMLRRTGFIWDLRRCLTYETYNQLDFFIKVGLYRDSFDRYLVRIEEIRQSLFIIYQAIEKLSWTDFKVDNKKSLTAFRKSTKISIETTIIHFKTHSQRSVILNNIVYTAAEAPKGEFRVFLITNGSNRPYRCKIRAPRFFHLQAVIVMAKNFLIADLVVIIRTLDIVFGEVDRVL